VCRVARALRLRPEYGEGELVGVLLVWPGVGVGVVLGRGLVQAEGLGALVK